MNSVPHRILCAVDLSPASIAALDLSIDLAQKYRAELSIVHAYTLPIVPFAAPGILYIDEGKLVASIERDLDRLIQERRGVAVVTERRAIEGWPGTAIVRNAIAKQMDLVVIGTRGLSHLPRFLLGSVAERVARTSPTDVLVVPEGAAVSARRQIRTILCGVDFSGQSNIAIRTAVEIARRHHSRLRLVHGWEPAWFAAHQSHLVDEHQHELEQSFRKLVRRIAVPEIEMDSKVGRGSPHTAVLDEARELGADLIVMGSTGKSGSHFLLGSVVERVLRLTTVPVWIARRDAAQCHYPAWQ